MRRRASRIVGNALLASGCLFPILSCGSCAIAVVDDPRPGLRVTESPWGIAGIAMAALALPAGIAGSALDDASTNKPSLQRPTRSTEEPAAIEASRRRARAKRSRMVEKLVAQRNEEGLRAVEAEERSAAAAVEQTRRDLLAERQANRPQPRTLVTPLDAELAARDWLRWMGFNDAEVRPVGPDGGIDVESRRMVAQVKARVDRSTRPHIQQLVGAGRALNKSEVFFSMGGFTREAEGFGELNDVALFTFDVAGRPGPVNAAARRLMGDEHFLACQGPI